MPFVHTDTLTYYHFRGGQVVTAAGEPVENLTGGVVKLASGAVVSLLEYPSRAPLVELVSSSHGLISDFYAAVPDGTDPDVYIDWPGDTIPPQPVDIAMAEVLSLVQAKVDAAMAGQTSLEPRVAALEGTAADLPFQYVQVHPHNRATGLRYALAGGALGFPADADMNAATDAVDVIGA